MGPGPTAIPWNVDTLRSTMLFSPMAPHVPRPIWPDILPGARTLTQGEDGSVVEMGAFEGYYLTVTQTPSRVDLVWNEGRDRWDQERLEAAGNRLPNVGLYGGLGNEAFDEMLRRFLGISGVPNRIAYAPILSVPVADQAEGYRILAERVGIDLNPQRVSDFQFQINRWRDSTPAAGARVNRLARWSVMQLARIEVLGQGAFGQVRQIILAQAARLEMDINVVYEDGRLLDREQLPAILDELIAAVTELAQDGDRA